MTAPILSTTIPEDRPKADWDLEKLAKYATDALNVSGSIVAAIPLLTRKSVVMVFRAGEALSYARAAIKQAKQWREWQNKHGLKKTPVNEAIRLFEGAKTEDALKGLTITEAKVKYGVVKPKPSQTSRASTSSRHTTRQSAASPTSNNTAGATSTPSTTSPTRQEATTEDTPRSVVVRVLGDLEALRLMMVGGDQPVIVEARAALANVVETANEILDMFRPAKRVLDAPEVHEIGHAMTPTIHAA